MLAAPVLLRFKLDRGALTVTRVVSRRQRVSFACAFLAATSMVLLALTTTVLWIATGPPGRMASPSAWFGHVIGASLAIITATLVVSVNLPAAEEEDQSWLMAATRRCYRVLAELPRRTARST